MVRPICDLPPLSESLRDSESHLNVHSRGHAGPHGVWGYYIHVLFNRWGKVLMNLEINPCADYNVQNSKGLNSPKKWEV